MDRLVAVEAPLPTLVASLADNKHFLGRRYAEWCTAAPALESAVAAAAMAQDEIGHARSLYPLLEDLVGPTPESRAETRTAFMHAPFLDQPFREWTDFIAANFVFDTALSVFLEGAQNSSFSALGQRARRILEEERLHWLHGEGWTRRLAREGGAVRAHLNASFAAVLPHALNVFALADNSLLADGVLTSGASDMRRAYGERVGPIARDAGLNLA